MLCRSGQVGDGELRGPPDQTRCCLPRYVTRELAKSDGGRRAARAPNPRRCSRSAGVSVGVQPAPAGDEAERYCLHNRHRRPQIGETCPPPRWPHARGHRRDHPHAPPNAESPLDRAGSAVDLRPIPLRLEAPLPRWPLLMRRAVALHTRPPRPGRKRRNPGSRPVVLIDNTEPRLARPPPPNSGGAGPLSARAHLVCREQQRRAQSRRSRGRILPLRTMSERLPPEPDRPLRTRAGCLLDQRTIGTEHPSSLRALYGASKGGRRIMLSPRAAGGGARETRERYAPGVIGRGVAERRAGRADLRGVASLGGRGVAARHDVPHALIYSLLGVTRHAARRMLERACFLRSLTETIAGSFRFSFAWKAPPGGREEARRNRPHSRSRRR